MRFQRAGLASPSFSASRPLGVEKSQARKDSGQGRERWRMPPRQRPQGRAVSSRDALFSIRQRGNHQQARSHGSGVLPGHPPPGNLGSQASANVSPPPTSFALPLQGVTPFLNPVAPTWRVHRVLFPGPSPSLSRSLFPSWKRIRSQQGFQENSNGQSFFVRNIKVGQGARGNAGQTLKSRKKQEFPCGTPG